MLAYDSSANRFVFFGGWNGTTLNQTWEYDPVNFTWTQLHPPVSPLSRADATFAYSPDQDEFLLFGGWTQYSDGTDHRVNDTWGFSLVEDRWTDLTSSTAPSPRSDAAAAYDTTDHVLFLFGGFSGSIYLGDAWRFQPSTDTWSPLSLAGSTPGARSDGRMVFDSSNNQFVLFGGNDYSGPNLTFHHLSDTWVFGLLAGRWTRVSTAISPEARDYAVEGFDPTTKSVLLFSGYGNRTILDDTWSFAPGNSAWSHVVTEAAPPGRYAGGGGFDSRDGLLLIVGGLGDAGLSNDTWVLDEVGSPMGEAGPPAVILAASALFLGVAVGVVLLSRRSRKRSHAS